MAVSANSDPGWLRALGLVQRTCASLEDLWVSNSRAPLALQRADVFSCYARVLSKVGRGAVGGGAAGGETAAAGPSGSVGGGGAAGSSGAACSGGRGAAGDAPSAAERRCAVEAEAVSDILRLLSSHTLTSRSTMNCGPELLAALGRSQVLEHAAAAALRLAAACPPQPSPAAASAGAAIAMYGWQSVSQLKVSCVRYFRGLAAAAMNPESNLMAAALQHTPSGGVSSSSASPGANKGSAGTQQDPSLAHQQAQEQASAALEDAVLRLVSGPATSMFLVWALLCDHATALQHAAAAEADDAAAPQATSHAAAAPGLRGAGLLPKGLVRPIAGDLYIGSCSETLCGLCKVMEMHLRADERAAQQQQQQQQQQPVPGQEQQQVQPSGGPAVPAAVLLPYPPVRLYDLLAGTLDTLTSSSGTAAPQEPRMPVITMSFILVYLASQQRPRQLAARLPGLWRHLLRPLGLELGWDTLTALRGVAMALDSLQARAAQPPSVPVCRLPAGKPTTITGAGGRQQGHDKRVVPDRQATGAAAGAAGSAVGTPGAGAGAAVDKAAAGRAAGTCCYSLRCALDAGLLPALERLVRNAPLRSGRDSSPEQPARLRNSMRETILKSALRISGVWPDLLAHAPVPQAVGLIATLTAAARPLLRPGPQPGEGRELTAAGMTTCGNLIALLHQVFCVRERSVDGTGSPGALAAQHGGQVASLAGSQTAAPQPPAPAARQALLASFALQQWLPLLLGVLENLARSIRTSTFLPASSQHDSGPELRLANDVVVLVGRVLMWATMLADEQQSDCRTATGEQDRAACGGAAPAAPASGSASAAPALAGARWAPTSAADGAAAVAAAETANAAVPAATATDFESWRAFLRGSCGTAMGNLVGQLYEVALLPAEPHKQPGSPLAQLEESMACLLEWYVAVIPDFASVLCLFDKKMADEETDKDKVRNRVIRVAWERHGRHAATALYDAVARSTTQQHLGCEGGGGPSSNGGPTAVKAEILKAEAERERAVKALRRRTLVDAASCNEQARAFVEWLLSPAEVLRQLRQAGVSAGLTDSDCSSSSSSSSGSSSSGGATAAASASSPCGPYALCGNTAGCTNLDGLSALIPPGGGKTCSRCKRVRYCCGACQLQHWREGGHSENCAGMVLAAGTGAARI
ncbi:hypothetical protein HYH02_001446 [Chlamydomonas schloesseri]|uniref:phytol kinase n=1 Tax=Chlamydomonas schloesseri TaxID=2026947 RepID=A0A835WXJ5_9CHLO|nr:hypothetical protein HYH02_001446 [Chlamydomonas schloesseri]|eukprot:KAG2454426.1 hypothetical protein HYH02_001446 [Chlamydomonas schloesseri]